MKGTLFFVATPIGNMKDITYRAVETLKSVDAILCEDTRHSNILLKEYNISKPLYAFHKFNYAKSIPTYIQMLIDGKNLALISDAGMPSISDPGREIIEELLKNDIPYTIIPGASAGLSALVLSGFSTQNFCFLGFLPEKKVTDFLEPYLYLPATLIFYSAVHDINRDIETLYKNLGDRKIAVVREITKMYENVYFTTLKKGYNGELKGEFVIIVEGNNNANSDLNNLTLTEHLQFYIDLGNSKNDAMKLVAKDRGVSKSEIYKELLNN